MSGVMPPSQGLPFNAAAALPVGGAETVDGVVRQSVHGRRDRPPLGRSKRSIGNQRPRRKQPVDMRFETLAKCAGLKLASRQLRGPTGATWLAWSVEPALLQPR